MYPTEQGFNTWGGNKADSKMTPGHNKHKLKLASRCRTHISMCPDTIIKIRRAMELDSVQTVLSSGLGREGCDDDWKEGPPVVVCAALWRSGVVWRYPLISDSSWIFHFCPFRGREKRHIKSSGRKEYFFLLSGPLPHFWVDRSEEESAMCYFGTSVTDNENVDFHKQGALRIPAAFTFLESKE